MRAAIASDFVYSAVADGRAWRCSALTHRCHASPRAPRCCWRRRCWPCAAGPAFFARANSPRFATGHLGRYAPIFRDLTRWSLLGVVFTELTVNAHAYLVTFISGPGAFALLALGMLLMRPASLMQSALPDLERPVMTRAIAAARLARAGAHPAGIRLSACWRRWGVTLVLGAVLLIWSSRLLVLKKGYDLQRCDPGDGALRHHHGGARLAHAARGAAAGRRRSSRNWPASAPSPAPCRCSRPWRCC